MRWVLVPLQFGDNMRTINEIHRDRLVAEAEEAETRGMVKIAENLTRQIEKSEVRDNNENYTYGSDDFEIDVQEALWDAVVRTADFHGSFVDSEKAQKIVEHYADMIISDIRKIARLKETGAYEPTLPGEQRQVEVISIEE